MRGNQAPALASGFVQPEVRRSSSGILRTRLRASIAASSIRDGGTGRAYTVLQHEDIDMMQRLEIQPQRFVGR